MEAKLKPEIARHFISCKTGDMTLNIVGGSCYEPPANQTTVEKLVSSITSANRIALSVCGRCSLVGVNGVDVRNLIENNPIDQFSVV